MSLLKLRRVSCRKMCLGVVSFSFFATMQPRKILPNVRQIKQSSSWLVRGFKNCPQRLTEASSSAKRRRRTSCSGVARAGTDRTAPHHCYTPATLRASRASSSVYLSKSFVAHFAQAVRYTIVACLHDFLDRRFFILGFFSSVHLTAQLAYVDVFRV